MYVLIFIAKIPYFNGALLIGSLPHLVGVGDLYCESRGCCACKTVAQRNDHSTGSLAVLLKN